MIIIDEEVMKEIYKLVNKREIKEDYNYSVEFGEEQTEAMIEDDYDLVRVVFDYYRIDEEESFYVDKIYGIFYEDDYKRWPDNSEDLDDVVLDLFYNYYFDESFDRKDLRFAVDGKKYRVSMIIEEI